MIEVHVQASDQLGVDDLLITESDKAAMEVPSWFQVLTRTVESEVGDKVKNRIENNNCLNSRSRLIRKLVCKQVLKPMTLLKTIRRRNLVVAVTLIPVA